jgi:hypothetical protein
MSLRPPPKLPSVLDDAGSPNQVQSRMQHNHATMALSTHALLCKCAQCLSLHIAPYTREFPPPAAHFPLRLVQHQPASFFQAPRFILRHIFPPPPFIYPRPHSQCSECRPRTAFSGCCWQFAPASYSHCWKVRGDLQTAYFNLQKRK